MTDDQKPRDVVLVILNRRPERQQAEDFGGARRGDRRGIVHLFVRDQLRAARRVVGRNHLDAGQRPEKPIALRQRLRVRINPAHPLHRAVRQREEMVHDRQLHLAHDRQVMLEEQVEVAVDAAADRVLNRQHAVAAGPPFTASKTSSKARQGKSCASALTCRAAASLNAPGSP